MSRVVELRRRSDRPTRPPPAAPPRAPWGGDVYLIPAGSPPGSAWTVCDESPSGGSAGTHGTFADHGEAVAEGRKLANEIDGTFHDGGAA